MNACFFTNLADCGLFRCFSRIDNAFWQLPAALLRGPDQRDLHSAFGIAEGHAAGGNLVYGGNRNFGHDQFAAKVAAMVESRSTFISGLKPMIFFTSLPL